MNHLTYAIVNIATDLSNIDFSQIGETSSSTIRKSVDETLFVIKWEQGHTPTFIIDSSVVPVGTYNHSDCLALMHTPEWQNEITL